MEAITEQYKTMSAENGVFGILYPTYVKHDFQAWHLFLNKNTDIYEFNLLGTLFKPPAIRTLDRDNHYHRSSDNRGSRRVNGRGEAQGRDKEAEWRVPGHCDVRYHYYNFICRCDNTLFPGSLAWAWQWPCCSLWLSTSCLWVTPVSSASGATWAEPRSWRSPRTCIGRRGSEILDNTTQRKCDRKYLIYICVQIKLINIYSQYSHNCLVVSFDEAIFVCPAKQGLLQEVWCT